MIGVKKAVNIPKRTLGHNKPQKLVAKAVKAVLAEKPKQTSTSKNFNLGK